MPDPPTTGQVRRLTQQEADLICAKHDRLWAAKPGGALAIFSWRDLTGLDFRGRMLNDADFTGAILDNAKFAKAHLDHAIFFGADVQNADFAGASMRRADLRGACMPNCDMSGADLFEADLREGVIAAADRTRGLRILEPVKRAGQAQGVNLTGANLERSKLSGVVAICADFTDAVLKDANLVRANLKSASFRGANLAGADLRGSIMVGTKTYAAIVSGALMAGALTDKLAGKDVGDMPYEQMIHDHALWCESAGKEGKPSMFDEADLRALSSLKGLNLTALSAKKAVFCGLKMEGVQL